MPPYQLAAVGLLAVAVVGGGIFIAFRMLRQTPEKRERKRRILVHQQGRLGEALILEATDATIYYTYSVAGVQYEASQDVAMLREYLPAEPERLVGTARLKYASNNPANSILVCEEWSGLRAPQRIQ